MIQYNVIYNIIIYNTCAIWVKPTGKARCHALKPLGCNMTVALDEASAMGLGSWPLICFRGERRPEPLGMALAIGYLEITLW